MSDPRRLPLVIGATASPPVARVLLSVGLRDWLQSMHRRDGRVMPGELIDWLDAVDVAARVAPELNGSRGTPPPREPFIVPTVGVDVAANELSLSDRRVRTLIAEGRLEATRPNGHAWRVARWSLDELIAQRKGDA